MPHLQAELTPDDATLARLENAVAVLAAVTNVRNSLQHAGNERRGVSGLTLLGLPYPVVDPQYAWQVVQRRTIDALGVLREEIQAGHSL